MTSELTFTSVESFEPDYIEQLRKDMDELAAERVWWNQPLALSPDCERDEELKGSVKIMRRYLESEVGPPRKIDYRDDVLMGMVDYLAILEALTALSKEHEFSWEVRMPAEPRPKLIGKIVEGRIDPKLFDFLLPELEALEITDRDLSDHELHQSIRQKYLG